MQARTEPLPDRNILSCFGLFLITQDELSVAPYVAETLQQRGAKTAILSTSTLFDSEQLATAIAQQRQINGPVTGIVHLAALAAIPLPETLSDWRRITQLQSKSLFQILRLCATDLQQVGCVLAASLLGGYFGRDGRSSSGMPAGGSSNGLLKTLLAEWSGVQAKAIDFDSSLSNANVAQHIVNELLLPGRLEVGYPQGNRTIFQTVPAPTKNTSTQLTPNANWVVLITGGARGITAEIASDLATYGLKLIVTGRSAEPTTEAKATDGVEDIAAIRKVLIEQSRKKGKSLTPVQIEHQLQELLRDRAIAHNLQRFRQAGAQVEYLSVDVKTEEFAALINDIYSRYGRLDAVIHGAGIIEDKLITDKSIESFERVFDTKVDSTFLLSRHLRPESLKLLVLFSSVAGRYGNRGQSDYAAANEVMNRFAWRLQQSWSNTRVVAINWGPWDTTGMASEGVKRQLREQGIIPIPVQSGCQFFANELHYGRKDETEVIAGEGPWEVYERAGGV